MIATNAMLKRFLRVVLAGAITAGVKFLSDLLMGLHLPDFLTPVIVAAISALGKYLREKYQLDLLF